MVRRDQPLKDGTTIWYTGRLEELEFYQVTSKLHVFADSLALSVETLNAPHHVTPHQPDLSVENMYVTWTAEARRRVNSSRT